MNEYQTQGDVDQIARDLDRTRSGIEETLHSMEQKFSSQYVFDRLHEYFPPDTVKTYVHNFSSTVAANPIPAALLGVSVAWLILGGTGRSRNGGAKVYESSAYDADVPFNTGGAYESRSAYEDGGSGATEPHKSSHRIADTVREKAAAVSERIGAVRDKAGSATHQITSKVQQAKLRTQGTVGHMRDRVNHMRNTVDNMRTRASEQGRRLQGTYNWMLQEHPLALGVIGLAVGAVIGATLAETDAEHRTMGKVRDKMKDRLAETASGVAEELAERTEKTAERISGGASERGSQRSEFNAGTANSYAGGYQASSSVGYGSDTSTKSAGMSGNGGAATTNPESKPGADKTNVSVRRVEGYT